MAGQLAFRFPAAEASSAEDFFLSGANRAAFALVSAWPDWPAPAAILTGPPGSGKTHLARIFRQRSGAVDWQPGLSDYPAGAAFVLEDAAGLKDEVALFHFLNGLRERGGFLLMTDAAPLSAWPFRLPDLTSRLAALPHAAISPPDDELLKAAITKLLADRQLSAAPGLVEYLAVRMERSLREAVRLVEKLDRLSLSSGRSLSLRLAQEALVP